MANKHFVAYHPADYEPPPGSWASSAPIRRSMVRCRSRDTKPEVALRSRLHRAGLRFRVQIRPLSRLRRTADIAFTRARVAVFIDGCFWHGCPAHYVPPATNSEYWSTKIAGNQARDRITDEVLSHAGWTIVRVWEHVGLDQAEETIRAALMQPSSPGQEREPYGHRGMPRSAEPSARHSQACRAHVLRGVESLPPLR